MAKWAAKITRNFASKSGRSAVRTGLSTLISGTLAQPKVQGAGTPSINVDPKEIRFEWEVKAKPLERRPRISLIVNRFSGKAFEIFLMLEKPHQGPEYA